MNIFDSKIIFPISILIAFLVPDYSHKMQFLLVPILMLMMTFSLKKMCFHHIDRKYMKTIVFLLIANYIILTSIYLLLTTIFIQESDYCDAIYVLAIMPPAVGIISLSFILKGDVELGFITEFLGYVFGIFFIPLMSVFLFEDVVSPLRIIKVLLLVIVVPFIASRGLHYLEHFFGREIDDSMTKSIVNILYGLSFYIIIGLNASVFMDNFESLIPVFVLLTFLKFGLGTLIFIFLLGRIRRKNDILYVLFGTFKNGGAATAITIMLFGIHATIPLAVNSILVPLYIIYLEWFILKKLPASS